jgi:hypothetical protein
MSKRPKKPESPKKPKRRLPKTAKEWEALSSDEVMQKIFGKRGQQTLKRQVVTDDDEPASQLTSR